ncbi:MAG: quinone-dependent dihydroorotate dehydrogenase [Bacteroidota bacterium]
MYKYIIRPIFFRFDPEKVHNFTVRFLSIMFFIPGIKALVKLIFGKEDAALERQVMGIKFVNPVGLAAGFDKDATMVDLLDAYGFSHIEIGTLTPKPQPGNDKPRLFRLIEDNAIINRMGFNNNGVEEAVKRLKTRKTKIIIGGNIGKNKVTPNDLAVQDYEYSFEALFSTVDYFVVNVSSPNTPNLRELQDKEPLAELLSRLQARNNAKTKRKPILLKIAPDLTEGQLKDIVDIVRETNIDGVIATNTTIERSGLTTNEEKIAEIGAGGLSGKPLTERSTEIIRFLREELGPEVVIIGVGGIMSPEDAVTKLNAGADLIQIYTGFIYNGPVFVKNINKAILEVGLN